jgi:chorismate mutase
MTELQELRKLIDHIDQDICHWLDYRLSLAEKVRKLKFMVEDPQRESEILNKIEYSTDYKNIESLKQIYQTIFEEMKKIQTREITRYEFSVKFSGKENGKEFYGRKFFDTEEEAIAGMRRIIDTNENVLQAAIIDANDKIVQSYTRGYGN